MLPVMVIPLSALRYIIVAGMWGLTALSSPFFMTYGKSLLQILMEYGLVLERIAPAYIEYAILKIENEYIPRLHAFLRWIPYVSRYIPSIQ